MALVSRSVFQNFGKTTSVLKIMIQVLRAALELTNIRCDPGPSGDLRDITEKFEVTD